MNHKTGSLYIIHPVGQYHIDIHLSIAPFNAIHTSFLYENAQNTKLTTELLNL